MKDYLYFDHAAATSVRPQAQQAVAKALGENLGNPSSVHQIGRKARGLIDEARLDLAEIFMVKSSEVIFTSGATEAAHTGIIGAYLALKSKRGVIYTSPLVHSCVHEALDFLAQNYAVKVKPLPLSKTGHIDLESIDEKLIGESDMIVIEHLNSEMGILQPAAKLGKKIIRWAEESGNLKPLFMVDTAASAVSERVGLDFQKCDLLTLSAEKIGGISGTGVLLKKENVSLVPLQGGTQEWGWRGGTENTLGILALHEAFKALFKNQEAQNQNLETIKKLLINFLNSEFPEVKMTTPEEGSGLHILHLILPQTPSSLFVVQADLQGVGLSAGSACSSGSVEGSKVLKALGFSDLEAAQGLRISWGWDTTLEETEALIVRLKTLLKS
ncbi:aminotransferase class V-fold PLP-dependent enzyme [bacterium]|nr:aminotransferase class V-fold PLP-dependent enzyme [bacterium]NCQ55605.1 aminotransferase class V-fold PLP-dependent enzyme [Candidatus Parcubacteria bacterium]NCS67430.1 aminotransferase class V-fold PLP-dependent enzyme [Candidatus Peregrinibacteria bacterium]NCS96156.1 aminotransferase class V-fold PLP-dependent enzyme [bacterium]